MAGRLTALIVTACLCGAIAIDAQTPPQLSRQQRDTLLALVNAVDAATAQPPGADAQWQTHVMRASDGSHYVAFTFTPPPSAPLPSGPVLLYVRLATSNPHAAQKIAEHSVVREWLSGSRVDPRLLPQRRAMAIGDMPAMGAGAIGVRGAASVGSADLQAMNLERQRARERRDEEARRRKALLEGALEAESHRLPFEDFDVVPGTRLADGTRVLQRALTTGPGDYDLFIAWADASQPTVPAGVQVSRKQLRLTPGATGELALSSVIVADHIGVRASLYSPLEQRRHPYTIGVTEVVPARDTVLTPRQQLAVVFQIVNPQPSPAGKPDLRVNLRIVRAAPSQQPVATLSPLIYNDATLPPDFDVRLGHPVIAAMAAPLATIPRGDYRLVISVEDRLGGGVVSGGTEFTVVGTPESLLAEAPPLGPRFSATSFLEPAVLHAVVRGLTPDAPSPVLARALKSAQDGRFADLLVADLVPDREHGIRAALSGLALVSLGNPAAIGELQKALQWLAPPAPVHFLIGGARAMAGRDTDAISAWEAARAAGFPVPLASRLLADAYLRQKDFARAAAAIGDRPAGAAEARTFAATRIGLGQRDRAIAALDEVLAQQPDDLDSRWLLLHALYSDFVSGTSAARDRAAAEARRYIDAGGPHRALAAEWLQVLTSS